MAARQIDIQADIVIIGGGVGGLTLAALLGQAGFEIVIVDPYKPAPFKKTENTGRTVALMESSLNILKAANVWDRLKAVSNPMEMMRIIDDSDARKDPIEIEFPASDIGLDAFGCNIPNGHLRAALFEHIKTLKNVRFIESVFSDYTLGESHIQVRLENKTSITARAYPEI